MVYKGSLVINLLLALVFVSIIVTSDLKVIIASLQAVASVLKQFTIVRNLLSVTPKG